METKEDLLDDFFSVLNDIKSEVLCRKDQESFSGGLDDAIIYVERLEQVLNDLNDDEYEEDE